MILIITTVQPVDMSLQQFVSFYLDYRKFADFSTGVDLMFASNACSKQAVTCSPHLGESAACTKHIRKSHPDKR